VENVKDATIIAAAVIIGGVALILTKGAAELARQKGVSSTVV